VLVDKSGILIDGDHILGLLANHLQQSSRLLGNTVVTSVMRNQGLVDYLNELGIKTIETPVGDKYVTDELLKIRSNLSSGHAKFGLGGEQAGHIIILDDMFKTGDGIRTSLFVMSAFNDSGYESFDVFLKSLTKKPQVIASAFVGDGKRLNKTEIEELRLDLENQHSHLIRINLRYSGTEPLFRMMLEGDSEISIDEIADIARSVCVEIQHKSGTEGKQIDILNCTTGGFL
jgi:phosphoglucosamine mutase